MSTPSSDEKEITSIIISCITSYGQYGVPLNEIQEEFEALCGYSIPYKTFGCDNVKSFLMTLPHIYVVKDDYNNEIVIEQSPKSNHIKHLISKQKHHQNKRKYKNIIENDNDSYYRYKKMRTSNTRPLPQGSSIHSSYNKKCLNDFKRFEEFQKLEQMLPVLYKHQALGDDFFVDLADSKLGCYVAEAEPRQCGLCEVGLTISKLTEKLKKSEQLAPRVVLMVGMNDLLEGKNANSMILDLRKLVVELKRRNTRVTIITLIPSPKLKINSQISLRMEIFNKAILEYGSDPDLKCNIIDMNKIFQKEIVSFKKDFDRLEKIGKNDPYKVFSDYGRKIFLSALKSCLREQIEHGH